VVEPGSGRLLVATGNATGSRPFDGVSNWSDSVLELSADAARLLHNWTPTNQAALSASDGDLGSTAPALPAPVGGVRLAVQGGKDGTFRLLSLAHLNGRDRRLGRLGGELQDVRAPGGAVSPALISLARSMGFITIGWDVDPRDWVRPGTGAIYANVVGNAHNGSIVLQHDGGGDRS